MLSIIGIFSLANSFLFELGMLIGLGLGYSTLPIGTSDIIEGSIRWVPGILFSVAVIAAFLAFAYTVRAWLFGSKTRDGKRSSDCEQPQADQEQSEENKETWVKSVARLGLFSSLAMATPFVLFGDKYIYFAFNAATLLVLIVAFTVFLRTADEVKEEDLYKFSVLMGAVFFAGS